MELLTVDKDKCLHCGICVQSCPACILQLGPEGPVCEVDHGCMSCGHCVAVCPVGALDNKYARLANMRPVTMPVLEPETAYEFLRMRRSIRCFKEGIPTEEELTRLLDVCRYAPTATNSQCMYYVVLRGQEKIKQVADAVASWMEQEVVKGGPSRRYYLHTLTKYREGEDIIARNAPCLIFALTKRLNVYGESSAEQCWAYAELFAPTLGLGTTIAGFITQCGLDNYQPLRDILGVAPKMKIVGCLMVGYPRFKYQRMPERQHLKVEFR